MTTIDRTKPVLVTGATGYVAGWLVKRLLAEGFTVHGTVRNPDDTNKVAHLQRIAESEPGTLHLFKADLLMPGAYAEAMQGCEIVFHTASPFTSNVKDAKKDLIEPAVLGTRNVLEEANRTTTVKRVVLTSSCAAIYGDNIDLKNAPNGVFTEEIWNTTSSERHQAYSYSKTLAEKEAWRINEGQSQWDLVVINPSLVIGPSLNPQSTTSESFHIIKQMGDGSVKTGMPELGFGVVDVRDVAEAHFKAGILPQAKGRHIVSGHNAFFRDLAAALHQRYGKQYPIPRRELPKALIWLVGPFINASLTREFVSKNVGYPFVADNAKSIRELGISYRSIEESMVDTFQQLIDEKLI
ncbi:MAG: aldehyde reductase [Leptonema illini]|uniref:Aldehyde reductase n=1 Tax=Leptonema illini TaxID=183 RepID=A0A833H1E7_9LEPT|nr:MAG: aldehyde reductase [Leptonema illini]